MSAFLPIAPLISQERLNPIISLSALLAESSADYAQRLYSLMMKKMLKHKELVYHPLSPLNPHTVVIWWEETPWNGEPYLVVKLNEQFGSIVDKGSRTGPI